MKGILIRLALFGVFFITVISWYFIPDRFFVNYSEASDEVAMKEAKEQVKEEKKKKKEKEEQKKKKVVEKKEPAKTKQRIKQSVPFIVQAPHAQWDEKQYQDACEEASMLMAAAWLQNDNYISKNDAEDRMEELFRKEKDTIGTSIDTSAEDTAKIFREHFGFAASVHENVTMEQIYSYLKSGSIVIAPTNGKALENPNFTNGGPDRHMLVIIGFDRKNGDFITNDPGTRVGKGYKYKDSTLYNAIRDYKTGEKEKIEGHEKNVIIVNR